MNNLTAYIYSLIILESRMSIEVASKVFNVNKDILLKGVIHQNFSCEKLRAIEFCIYENEAGFVNTKKSIFIGKLLFEKYKKILKSENNKGKLILFIKELEGKEKIDALFEKNISFWTIEDKEQFFKYKIKFAVDNHELPKRFPITRQTISRWVSNHPEGNIKEELLALNGFVSKIYADTMKGR